MAITHVLSLNWSGSSGATALQNTVSLTGQEESNFSVTMTSSAVNQGFAMAFTATKLIEQYIVADQNCTIYINGTSGGSPAFTFTLTGGDPFIWYTGNGMSSPYASTNVTTAYVTANTTATTTNLNIRTLLTSP